jgi:hypothetical protein
LSILVVIDDHMRIVPLIVFYLNEMEFFEVELMNDGHLALAERTDQIVVESSKIVVVDHSFLSCVS